MGGSTQQKSFTTLKAFLVSSGVMAASRLDRPFKLNTDASDYVIGAILVQQEDDQVERVVQYISHALSPTQTRWATIKKEAYSVVFALDKLRPYLLGAECTIHTDHKPLKFLFTKQMENTKIQRWSVLLAEFGARICCHPGKLTIRADLLSRIKPPTSTPINVIDTDDWVSPDHRHK